MEVLFCRDLSLKTLQFADDKDLLAEEENQLQIQLTTVDV
jgi:hypothetical protein